MTREEKLAYQRAYYHANKHMWHTNKPTAEHLRAKYAADPERFKATAKRARRKLRVEFLAAYGGKCNCCGEQEPAFLTLEHKNRDGANHRKHYSTSSQILAALRRLGWPKDNYEILCFNCNRASWELGVCPHRKGQQHV